MVRRRGIRRKQGRMAKPTNLVQTDFGYCFRIIVPEDLRSVIGKTEIRYSLKERSLVPAKRKASLLAKQVKQLFSSLRLESKPEKVDTTEIQTIIQEMVRDTIEGMAEDKLRHPIGGYSAVQDRLDIIDFTIHDYGEALAVGDYRVMYPFVDHMIEEKGLDIKPGSAEYEIMAGEMLRAHIHLLKVDREQVRGDFSYSFQQKVAAAKNEEVKESESIGEIAAAYWSEKHKSLAKRTLPEYQKFMETLLDFIGKDTMIHLVDYETGRNYKEHLKTLTTAKGEPLSVTRMDLYLGFAKGLFQYAVRNHHVTENPFTGLQVGKNGKKRSDLQRKAFTTGDLEKLFVDSPEYGKGQAFRPDYWWIPVIGLFTGMRLEEICQLHVSDIKKVDGVFCFDINDNDPQKSVKTGEQRLVPIHDALIDFGLLEYVETVKNRKRLFPELKRINHRWGHAFGQYFGRFKTRQGFDADHSFHSLRHTVATRLSILGVDDFLISQLLGHASEGQTKSRYVKKHPVNLLKQKVVDRLTYDIDLSHLKGAWKRL